MMTQQTDRRGPWTSIADIRKANEEAEHHFFDRDTLKFFDSRIERTIYGGRFFLTSEQFHGTDGYSGSRRWTVRAARDDGNITTMGEFNELSRDAARAMARDYADRLRKGETLKDQYGRDI